MLMNLISHDGLSSIFWWSSGDFVVNTQGQICILDPSVED